MSALPTIDNRTNVETTTYTFDALNRLETVTDPDDNVTTYTYDDVGNRETVTYPNNTQASYSYDSRSRLTYLENRDLTTSIIISSYTYDLGPAGNRLAVTEQSGRRVEYAYDDLYQLVGERIYDDGVTLADDIAYTYDAGGNRLTKTDNSGTIAYSYDANDRLLVAGGITFAYDANGNTLSKTDASGTVYYSYDYRNRLIDLDDPLDGLTTYGYGPIGNRVSKTDASGTTTYLVDTNRAYAQVLQEQAPDGSLTRYVYGGGLISRARNADVNYYHYDGNLSVRQLTGADGFLTNTYTYDAFGNLLASTGAVGNDYLYTGQQHDSNSGLYYLRARYYNPQIGRFLTRDTYAGSCGQPLSFHKYTYVHNNPIANFDPSGHSLIETLAVTSISNMLSALRLPVVMGVTSIVAAYVTTHCVPVGDPKLTNPGQYVCTLAQDQCRREHVELTAKAVNGYACAFVQEMRGYQKNVSGTYCKHDKDSHLWGRKKEQVINYGKGDNDWVVDSYTKSAFYGEPGEVEGMEGLQQPKGSLGEKYDVSMRPTRTIFSISMSDSPNLAFGSCKDENSPDNAFISDIDFRVRLFNRWMGKPTVAKDGKLEMKAPPVGETAHWDLDLCTNGEGHLIDFWPLNVSGKTLLEGGSANDTRPTTPIGNCPPR